MNRDAPATQRLAATHRHEAQIPARADSQGLRLPAPADHWNESCAPTAGQPSADTAQKWPLEERIELPELLDVNCGEENR